MENHARVGGVSALSRWGVFALVSARCASGLKAAAGSFRDVGVYLGPGAWGLLAMSNCGSEVGAASRPWVRSDEVIEAGCECLTCADA